MPYAKIEKKIVVFKTYEKDESLIEISDDICVGMIQNNDGSFIEKKSNEQLFDEIRDKRNRLLYETDWWCLSDQVPTNEQQLYRKKLRDLPATNADPSKIVFPVMP